MEDLRGKKRGQITIFIIIGILIVAGVSLFFILREDVSVERVPAELEPVYNSFQSCVEAGLEEGINRLETQGGYIYFPEYRDTVGPFSSWFYFSGTSIPYWSYTQGGVGFEQVPSKNKMENDLEQYLETQVQECSFVEYENQGFDIEKGEEAKANVEINDNNVNVDLDMDFSIQRGEETALVETHEVSVSSKLGDLYESAKKIYEKEKNERFLEEYGIDILRLYAPVDGVELQCSPLIWDANNVFSDLETALETNTMALSSGGQYQNRDKYFNAKLDIDNSARFVNSRDWEHSFEVVPSEDNKLISEPVGNNPALGALGFCYNAYHFVYDMKYPVLVQVYDSQDNYRGETFQFPMGVVIEKNQPREPLNGTAEGIEPVEVCNYKNTNMTINTYDLEGEPVDSRVNIECLNTRCYLGETGEDGSLKTNVPQCANGQLEAKAEGFKTTETTYSTVGGGSINMYLNPLYKLNTEVLIEGSDLSQYSDEISRTIVSFDSDEHSKTIVYPQEREISLSEGQYSVEVYIYGNASMSLDQTTQEDSRYCIDISDGIAGSIIPGQKCFDIDSPEAFNSNALIGGGKSGHYFSESTLKDSEKITLNIDKFSKPESLGDLQENYEKIETKDVSVSLI